MVSLIIWQGNRSLHFSLRTYFDWVNKPLQKVGVLLLTILFYTIPVSVLLLIGWYKLFTHDKVNWTVITESTLIILVAVMFITHVYETVFLVKESESEMIRNEQLERAKAEAELEALKNQIDPHFIFNSLNTLTHLIEENPARAKLFSENMADVYRYILQNKAKDLVMLKEEISFIQSYFSLLQIRFGAAVQLRVSVPESVTEQYLIPPISLQLLIENAIKHNKFSENSPLVIEVQWQPEKLIIHNIIKEKETQKISSKIGLQNLKERYKLTTGKEIIIEENTKNFTVHLPVLKLA